LCCVSPLAPEPPPRCLLGDTLLFMALLSDTVIPSLVAIAPLAVSVITVAFTPRQRTRFMSFLCPSPTRQGPGHSEAGKCALIQASMIFFHFFWPVDNFVANDGITRPRTCRSPFRMGLSPNPPGYQN